MFEEIYEELIYRQIRVFNQADSKYIYDNISDVISYENYKRILYTGIKKEIKMMSQSVLVVDINETRENGGFRETDFEAQYVEYVNHFFDSSRFDDFCNRYSLWLSKCKECIKSIYVYVYEICENYKQDRAKLKNAGILAEIDGHKVDNIVFLGDAHNSWRSVALCEIGNYKVIYKPINGMIYELYSKIINIVSGNQSYKKIKCLIKESYFWCEYVKNEECGSIKEIQDFYRNSGYVLACCYILNSVDIHNENIIACGVYPVLIDIETGLSTDINYEDTSEGRMILEKSVFQSSMLPMNYDKRKEGTCDCSALGEAIIVQYEINELENEYTSIVREYRKKELQHDTNIHLPKIRGEVQPAWNYIDEIIDGFCEGYNNIQQNLEEIIRILEHFKTAKIRVVLRRTVVYAELLKRINMPDMLVDKKKTERFLKKFLSKNQLDETCTQYEIEQLITGNIPYFNMTISQGLLRIKNNEKIINRNMTIPISKVYEKLYRLSKEDKSLQCKFIRIALNDRGTNSAYIKSENLEQISREINKYMERAELHVLSKRCFFSLQKNWKGQYIYDEMNEGIYEGYLGIYLYSDNEEQIGFSEYLKIYNRILENKRWGVFNGYAALILFIYNTSMYTKTDKEKEIVKLCEEIEFNIPNEINLNTIDILDGVAGTVIALNHFVYDVSRSTKEVVVRVIRNMVNKIIELWYAKKDGILKVSGIAHGVAGIKIAVYIAYYLSSEERILDTYLEMENADDVTKYRTINWCNGIVGYYIADYILWQFNHNDLYLREKLRYGIVQVMDNIFNTDDFCLCHGFLGAYDFLLLMKQNKLLTDTQERLLKNVEKNMLKELRKRSICISDISLFTGINGIKYIEKRMNQKIPSILSFLY